MTAGVKTMHVTAVRLSSRRLPTMCSRLTLAAWSRSFAAMAPINETFFEDPSKKLQQYLQIPLFKENEAPFQPSPDDIVAAKKLFVPRFGHDIKFAGSYLHFDSLPVHNIPEVAFVGRSNVGKSSLLKTVLSDVPGLEVRVSKKPGMTKLVNLFQVGRALCLVDLPGYGFHQPKHFVEGVEMYLKNRKNLARTMLLIDCKVGFTDLDLVAVDMLEEFQIPYAIILTKIDKTVSSRQLTRLMELRKIREKNCSPSCFMQPFMFSAVSGEGLGFLLAFLAHVTGNVIVK